MSDTENLSFVVGLLWSKMFLSWSVPDLSVSQAPVFLFPKTISEMKKKVDVSPQGKTRRRWTNCKVALTDLRANHGRGRGLIQNFLSKIYRVLRTISEPKNDNLVAIEDRIQNRWSKSWNELQESQSQRIVRTTSSDFFHQFIYFSESKVCL